MLIKILFPPFFIWTGGVDFMVSYLFYLKKKSWFHTYSVNSCHMQYNYCPKCSTEVFLAMFFGVAHNDSISIVGRERKPKDYLQNTF